MTDIEKFPFRIVGAFALVSNVALLIMTLVGLFQGNRTPNLIQSVTSIAIYWTGIYGGYQLLQAKAIGRRLLQIVFTFQAVQIVLVGTVLLLTSGLIKNVSLHWNPPLSSDLLNFLVGYAIIYILSIPMLLVLLKKLPEENLEEHQRHQQFVGKILALLTPGLGRALVGNFWAGMALFALYWILAGAGNFYIRIDGKETALGQFLVNLAFGGTIWFIFSQLDLWAILSYKESLQAKPEPVLEPETSQPQING